MVHSTLAVDQTLPPTSHRRLDWRRMTELKEKVARTQQQGTCNTQRGHSEEPGPGEQRILHCRTPKDLFFISPLLSIARDIPDFSNKEKHRVLDKMRRQTNMSQMKEDQTTARDLREMDMLYA